MSYRRGWTTITTRYAEITAPAVRYGCCPGCGRRVTRRKTFMQTVNPWNKITDGSRAKTADEVQKSVRAEAAAWAPDPETFRHAACRGEGS